MLGGLAVEPSPAPQESYLSRVKEQSPDFLFHLKEI